MSSHTHSSHLSFGLPTYLISGLVLNILLMILFSLSRITYPTHLSLFSFIYRIMSGSLNSLYNSWLYLLLHVQFSSIGPKIYLKILLSKVLNSLSFNLDSGQVSEA
jgi:hypothetical protein